MRIDLVHSFDKPSMRLLTRLVRVLGRNNTDSESRIMTKLALITGLALTLIADAKANKDAFAAWRTADETRAAKLQTTIDTLTKLQSGETVPQEELDAALNSLTEVHGTLTGTTGDAVAAAALIDAPAPIAPTDATTTATTAPAPDAGGSSTEAGGTSTAASGAAPGDTSGDQGGD